MTVRDGGVSEPTISIDDQIAHIEYCRDIAKTEPILHAQVAMEEAVLASLRQFAQMEANDKRYRWLRDSPTLACFGDAELDAAIDRARAAERGKE